MQLCHIISFLLKMKERYMSQLKTQVLLSIKHIERL